MFCTNCGNNLGEHSFCQGCGERSASAPPPSPEPPPPSYTPPPPPPPSYTPSPPQQPPQQQYYEPPQPQYHASPPPQYSPPAQPWGAPRPHYAPGSYAETLHSFAKHQIFLIGIILYSAGILLSSFIQLNIFGILVAALPITAMWLIYAAAISPRLPEKTLPALTLFKASAIVDLVLICLGGLGMLIGAIALFIAAGFHAGFAALGFFMLLFAGGTVIIYVLYFISILKVLEGIKYGIQTDTFFEIPGIKRFTTLTYVFVGISALSLIFSLVAANTISGFYRNFFFGEFGEFAYIFDGLFAVFGPALVFSSLFALVGLAGMVVCVVVLNNFNACVVGKLNPGNAFPESEINKEEI